MDSRTAARLLAALAVVLLAYASAAGAQTFVRAEDRLAVHAKQAFADGLYELAAAKAQEFVRRFPDSTRVPQFLLLAGEALVRSGKPTEALALYERLKAHRLSPRHEAEVHYWTGQCLLTHGEFDEAREAFAAVARRSPRSPYVPYAALGQAACRLFGEAAAESALAEFERLAAESEDTIIVQMAALWQARAMLTQGKPAEASQRAKMIADGTPIDPVRRQALFLMGEAALAAAQPAEALALYAKSVDGEGFEAWYPEAYYGIAWVYIEQQAYERAEALLGEIRTLWPDHRVVLDVEQTECKVALLKGDPVEAVRRIDAYRERHRSDVPDEMDLLRGDAFLNAKSYEDALSAYDAVLAGLDGGPFVGRARFGRGVCLEALGRGKEALESLRLVLEATEDRMLRAEALKKIGDMRYAAEDYALAAEAYREVVGEYAETSDIARVAFQLGWSLYKQNDYEGAADVLARLIEAHPTSEYADDALYRVGMARLRAGRYEEAVTVFERFSKEYADSPLGDRVAYHKGVCQFSLGSYHLAVQAFRRVVRDFPKSRFAPRAAYEVGWCLYRLGQKDEAVAQFQGFIKTYPQSALTADVLFWLAEHAYNAERFSEAAGFFEVLVKQFPEHPLAESALYWQGRSEARRGRHKEAIDVLPTLVETYPESDLLADARYHIGCAQMALDQAAQALETLGALEKDFPVSHLREQIMRRRGDALLALGTVAQAQAAYRQLSESADPALRGWSAFGLAMCAAKQGLLDEAVGRLNEVIWDFASEKEVVGHAALEAGRIYERLGRRSDAIIAYRSIIDKDLAGREEATARLKVLRRRPRVVTGEAK